VCTLAQGINSD